MQCINFKTLCVTNIWRNNKYSAFVHVPNMALEKNPYIDNPQDAMIKLNKRQK